MNLSESPERWIIAVTGASGVIYGRRLIQLLGEHRPEIELEVLFSDSALRVMAEEEGINCSSRSITTEAIVGRDLPQVTFHNNKDIGASIASGSFNTRGMVVVPCSIGTLAAIAAGLSDSLIRRAADVTLKEGRSLLLVPRETPLSSIHLENLLKLSRAGARIIPAMPGFYHRPQSLMQLVDMVVMKIADQMGYRLPIVERWKEKEEQFERHAPKRSVNEV